MTHLWNLAPNWDFEGLEVLALPGERTSARSPLKESCPSMWAVGSALASRPRSELVHVCELGGKLTLMLRGN